MNSVHLIGRLATDVEVKEVNGGSKVTSFLLAVDRNAEEAEVAFLQHRLLAQSRPCRTHGGVKAQDEGRSVGGDVLHGD